MSRSSYCLTVRPLIIFPLILAFFLISCHSKKESLDELSGVKGRPPEKYRNSGKQNEDIYMVLGSEGSTYLNWNGLSQILTLFNGATDCQDCSLSSGYLIAREVLNGGGYLVLTDFCQGNLTSEDVFLVDRQCLPESVSSSGDSCENEIQIVLPQFDDHPMEILRCDQLMSSPVGSEQVNLKLKDSSSSERVPSNTDN